MCVSEQDSMKKKNNIVVLRFPIVHCVFYDSKETLANTKNVIGIKNLKSRSNLMRSGNSRKKYSIWLQIIRRELSAVIIFVSLCLLRL